MTDDQSKVIYDQDCQFLRYHDGLMWRRFQTAATIEAAVLYGSYQVQNLDLAERLVLVIVGTLLVGCACALTFANRYYAQTHLKRIRAYEADWPLDARHAGSMAIPFLIAASALIAILNVIAIIDLACKWSSSPR